LKEKITRIIIKMRENDEEKIVLNENNESNFFFECLAKPFSAFILLLLKITNPLIHFINK